MEDNTVTTVNEQLENLEDIPEVSNTEAQSNQTSSVIAVDEELQTTPDNEELSGPNEDATSDDSTSTGNLNKE